MKVILVSKCSLDIEQYVKFKMSVLISPSKILISSRWVTYIYIYIYTETKCIVGVEELQWTFYFVTINLNPFTKTSFFAPFCCKQVDLSADGYIATQHTP